MSAGAGSSVVSAGAGSVVSAGYGSVVSACTGSVYVVFRQLEVELAAVISERLNTP